MTIRFYDSIEGQTDKTTDLKSNLVNLFDDLLQEGGIKDAAILSTLAQLRARVLIDLSQLT